MGQRYFTHYWSLETWQWHRHEGYESKPLDHTAGSQFCRRGVSLGDRVYALSSTEGKIVLIGRMEVDGILSAQAAERARSWWEDELWEPELWDAPEHLIAKPDTATAMRHRLVSPRVARKLEFLSPNGLKRLTFESPGRLDRQTLRGVRELTPRSAALLDALLRRK